eukprot:965896-Amphidinium_carterae.1
MVPIARPPALTTASSRTCPEHKDRNNAAQRGVSCHVSSASAAALSPGRPKLVPLFGWAFAFPLGTILNRKQHCIDVAMCVLTQLLS